MIGAGQEEDEGNYCELFQFHFDFLFLLFSPNGGVNSPVIRPHLLFANYKYIPEKPNAREPG
jgi:hypothetical protein